MCPSAKLPPEFSGVAEGLAGVLQLNDMTSPSGVATNTWEASGEKETAGKCHTSHVTHVTRRTFGG